METIISVLESSPGFVSNWISELSLLALGALATLLTRWWRRSVQMGALRRAFGRTVADPRKFFLSVPLWSCKEGDRGTPRFARRSPTGIREEHYGPDDTFAKDDILGAMLISDMLARYFKKPLTVIPDDEKINWDQRTGILIGAQTANFHVGSVLKAYESTYPDDILVEIRLHEENEETQCKLAFIDKADGTVFMSDDSQEYALIHRLSNRFSEDKAGYIFIVAGVHSTGTYAAAQYLSNRWAWFAKKPGSAAVLLRLERGHPETALVVREYRIR